MHVVVEKPIAPTWEDYVEMRDAARERGLLLIENYNWRFVERRQAGARAKAHGRIGEVVNVEVSFGGVMQDPSDPLGDRDVAHFAHALPGGALQNFATHPISLALAFMDGFTGVAAWQRKLDPAWLSSDELKALLAGERSSRSDSRDEARATRAFHPRGPGHRGDDRGRSLQRATARRRSRLRHSQGHERAPPWHELSGRHGGPGREDGNLPSRSLRGPREAARRVLRRRRHGAPSPIPISEMDSVNEVVRELFAAENQL